MYIIIRNGIPVRSSTDTCHVHTEYGHHSNVILLTINTPAVQHPGPSQQVTRRNVATDGDLRDTGKLTK